jgi:TPR repeat protein
MAESVASSLVAEDRPEAMYLLGAIRRMHKDEPNALRWFQAGAARGYPPCMFEIGTAAINYADTGLARFWLGRAAVAGDINAMANLAALLIREDPDGARLWWERAAANGSEAAMLNLRSNFGDKMSGMGSQEETVQDAKGANAE